VANLQRSLVLFRELKPPVGAPMLPAGFTSFAIRTTSDERFPLLCRSCETDGLPAGWAERMISQNHEAHLLLSEAGESAGCAWIARQAYYISEISRTFDPGPEGDYYFGDFIPPRFRGRKLHRVLIELRVAASLAAGRRYAVGMTHSENLPSIKGYRSADFEIAAELRSRPVGRWRLDSMRWHRPRPNTMQFSTEGLYVPLFGRMRRRAFAQP
jgi:hypothetical protein